MGQGNKINCIFTENQAVLLERRSLLQQLTEEIDRTAATIQQHEELRGGQGGFSIKDGLIHVCTSGKY